MWFNQLHEKSGENAKRAGSTHKNRIPNGAVLKIRREQQDVKENTKKKKMYKLTQLDELTAVEKQRFNSYKAKKKRGLGFCDYSIEP